jgi:hypothetical protein
VRLQLAAYKRKRKRPGANTMGSTFLGRSVAGLVRLASHADFCSARHGGPLATGAIPQILGPTLKTQMSLLRKTAVASEIRRLIRQMAIASPLWRAP